MADNEIESFVWKLRVDGADAAEQNIKRVERAVNNFLNRATGGVVSLQSGIGGVAGRTGAGAGGAGGGNTPGFVGVPGAFNFQAGRMVVMPPTGAPGGAAAGGAGGALGVPGMQAAAAMAAPILIGAAIAGATALAGALRSALADATTYAREVLTIQSLSGSTTHEAAGFATLGRIAGISDMADIREITRSAQSLYTQQGSGALGILGVEHGKNEDSIQVINKVIDALAKMPDGIRKTHLEMEAFGQRGAVALQPLIRATEAQRMAIARLTEGINENALHALDQFAMNVQIMQATLLQKIVIPVAADVAGPLNKIADTLQRHGAGNFPEKAINTALETVFLGPILAVYNNFFRHQDKIARNSDKMVDSLQDIRGQLIGGGERARRVTSELEVEFAVARLRGKGLGVA